MTFASLAYVFKRESIFFLLGACLILVNSDYSALTKIDSLLSVLNSSKSEDTNKVLLLNKIGKTFAHQGKYNESFNHINKALKLAQLLNYRAGEAHAYQSFGVAYESIDEYEKAVDNYSKALAIFKEEKLFKSAGVTLNSLGNIEEIRGNYPQSLKHYFEYLNYAEKTKSDLDIAICYNNIAIVYADLGDFKKEQAYNYKALKIREKLNDPEQLAASYNNIGVAYQNVDNYELAVLYYSKALKLREKLNDSAGIAAGYHNIAICQKHKGNFKLAEENYLKALDIQNKTNNKDDIVLTYINIGILYDNLKRPDKSAFYLKEALRLATELELIGYQTDSHYALHELYTETNKPAEALIHFKKYIELRDSLNNVEKTKEFTRIEMQNQFDKELSVRQAEQEKKDAVQAQLQKQQRIVIISVSVLLLIISIFLVFVYRNYKQKQQSNIIITKQKQEVENQKHLIEEKQKEIIDSINYAQRIQSAILATEKDIKIHLPESYLLYKPKDIVAGDFYFFETTATHIFYAAADCTGHGVPGALVSVVCSNALTRCIKEFNISDPGLILDKTRELVLETFKKSGQDVKDGMDISLCRLPLSFATLPNVTLLWAGANNPLWYAVSTENEMKEITANKQPIGLVESPTPFTTHKINLNRGDIFYLFTDGYADQFGGPKGKKFKYKQLADLLLSLHNKPLFTQKEELEKQFNLWKGELDQVDDVCVIGIKI